MSNHLRLTLAERVQRTVLRLGFNHCVLQGIHEGRVTLFCSQADRNDRSMIKAALRTIPGITSVVFSTNSDGENHS